MHRLLFILILFFLAKPVHAQFDTTAIVRQLDQLVSIESHRAWWADVYKIDQSYRGHLTVDSLDNLNSGQGRHVRQPVRAT
ncbi:MAG: hypothetical protein IPJ06_15210 [Saprospiraceae bacterium]|nr:hypothetical protein [Saprospiraceae bacterium]